MSEYPELNVVYFPPGVIDGNGRRLRPGNTVQFVSNGQVLIGEIVAWLVDGVSILINGRSDEDEEWFVRNPTEVFRTDIQIDESVTTGSFLVELNGPSSVVVQGIGTRDLEVDANSLPPLSGLTPRAHGDSLREWSVHTLVTLLAMDEQERKIILQNSIRAPLLERVLQESALPRVIEKLVLVATDQIEPHPHDTVASAQILVLWLEANGYVMGIMEPHPGRRWIRDVEISVISQLPHVIDAVVFQLKPFISSWVQDCQRIVVVHAGGTPAMNTAILISSVQYSHVTIRHVQVPEPHQGTNRIQPLIEFDLTDLPELGKALGRDK
jgi:hypothetical protein